MAVRVLHAGSGPLAPPAAPPGEVEWVRCKLAREALDSARAQVPSLAVLGTDLDDMPGLSLLRVLRETPYGASLPVIVVSSAKSPEAVREAFELGADDFLVLPVDPRELWARINAVLRRKQVRSEQYAAPLSLGGIEIDPSQRLCLVRGKRVVLRPMEFALLDTLMRRAGRVLSRPYLLETVWGMSHSAETRAVDVMVSRLRKRLGARGILIETVSKMGYCFREHQRAR